MKIDCKKCKAQNSITIEAELTETGLILNISKCKVCDYQMTVAQAYKEFNSQKPEVR